MSTINLDVNGTYTANINAAITFSPGVTHITVTAIGGGGGQGNYSGIYFGGAGGGGGSVTSNFNVNSTDTLSLYIGLPGSGGGGGFTGFATNDFSGGGNGGYSNNAGAGGGGAATCVTLTRSSLSFVLLVAGGGGGGSIASTSNGSNGGYGGGNGNGDGSNGVVSSGGTSGGGGLSDGTGGAGGSLLTNGITGSFDTLTGVVTVGNGGGGTNDNGGGGGGGFGGGGGNNDGGGGGGSSFVNTNFNTGFESSVSYSYVTTTYNDSSVTPVAGSGGYIGDQSLLSGASGFHGQVIITAFGDPPAPAPASGGGNSVDQTCFRKGTRILTADSRYVNVEKLKTGDVLFTSNGPKDIVDIIRFTSSFDKHPLYVLPKHILGINAPNRDLYMSNNHAFKHNGLWHHMKCSRVTKLLPIKEIDYYHISLGNYFNYTIVAENIEVESCFVYKLDDMTIASWECNKVCCQPLKITKIVEPKLHFMAERIDLPGKLDPGKLDGDKKGKDKGKEKGKGKVRLNEIDQISLKKEFMYNESMTFDTYQTNGSHKQGHKQTSIEKFMNTTQKFRF